MPKDRGEIIATIATAINNAHSKNKKKTLINTFECGPYTWKEFKVPKDSVYLDSGDPDTNVYGLCDTYTQHIYLSEGLNSVLAAEVQTHERMHAIFFSYFNSLEFHEVEEELVTGISRGLMQIKKSCVKS